MPQRLQKLLDQVRDAIRLNHHVHSTNKTYVCWANRFVLKANAISAGEVWPFAIRLGGLLKFANPAS
jgi:hypothetical protein